ncbi:MAG: type II toxin-antitoxin system RelE/ParE family toxin [Phycisphaerales bacterium]
MSVKRLVRARADVVAAYEFIARDSVQAAERFLDACEATFDRLARWPGIGRKHPGIRRRFGRIRTFRIEGFPNHLVLYEVVKDGIVVVRVVHGARDFGSLFDEHP